VTRYARRLLVLAAVVLAGCGPAHVQPQSTRTPSHVVTVTPSQQPGLRSVHSPGQVVDDMHAATGSCHARGTTAATSLPDPACTPGAIDPALTKDIICAPGFTTRTVRPPNSQTDKAKTILMRDYTVTGPANYELDHLVPLELGGANTYSNLWPELGPAGNPKDKLENRLHTEVCAGTITLDAAQQEIAANWTTTR
jgi:hypothetical protein